MLTETWGRVRGRPGALLVLLASPHLMVAVFLLTGAGALAASYGWADATPIMVVPFGLLTLNLAAAVITRPRFRADVPLLLFHIALLAMVLLFGAARLTFFDGGTTLSNGMSFDGALLRDERGPWHPDRLAELRFANEGFTENFPRRGLYHATYNRVRWWDEQGGSHIAEIGDDRPLLLNGYRIYPTRFRGFSPVFVWRSASGVEDMGAVQLNDTQNGGFAPANEWQLPDGPTMWAMLELAEERSPPPGYRRADLDAERIEHVLIIRVGQERHELRPGERLELPEGVLTYVRLDSWMGYRITYDPTGAWLIATVLVAIGCLFWFYARRFRRRGQASEVLV